MKRFWGEPRNVRALASARARRARWPWHLPSPRWGSTPRAVAISWTTWSTWCVLARFVQLAPPRAVLKMRLSFPRPSDWPPRGGARGGDVRGRGFDSLRGVPDAGAGQDDETETALKRGLDVMYARRRSSDRRALRSIRRALRGHVLRRAAERCRRGTWRRTSPSCSAEEERALDEQLRALRKAPRARVSAMRARTATRSATRCRRRWRTTRAWWSSPVDRHGRPRWEA